VSHLPVIVGFGGINSAGRASSHYAYRRMVIDKLSQAEADQTLINLAVLMGLIKCPEGKWLNATSEVINLEEFLTFHRELILNSTLIRKLETNLFDNSQLYQHSNAVLSPIEGESLSFTLPTRKLPERIPSNWQVSALTDKLSQVIVSGNLETMLPDIYQGSVNCAGQLPSGFDPAGLYPSRNHPRSLQMTIYGASDALFSMGIDWETVRANVNPDQIAVYAGSGMSQLDYNGNAGMLQARLLGKRVTSKQLPLGLAEMPADFINAYMLGNIGKTACNIGACASFHYSLNQAIRDIQNGTHRVVVVGNSEAPLSPEIFEGYSAMGALADDEKLRALDGLSEPNYRRACRPFANNAGFTLAESAQFVVLFDDELALNLGANIHGAINDVFVNADGHKKSIASPGIGNYLTVAKAAAATKAVLGEQALRHKTFVQAHGTGTPQNRVTESAIFDEVAAHFGIENWPVSAVKSYIGHSIACAGADQLCSSLGIWKHGIIPGILTTDAIADDVHQQHLDFLLEHREIDPQQLEAILLNAKGFGGNNATASLLSPSVAQRMMRHKHGEKALSSYQVRNEKVAEASSAYEELGNRMPISPIYKFDHAVRDGHDLSFTKNSIKISGESMEIDLQLSNPYSDMCD
tara:strand:- start:124720 stop:126627 length:1908 start_codon:yes stop_codon:yes gene_type:complete